MKLIRFDNSSGGGMRGENSRITVHYTADGKCLVNSSGKDAWNTPTYIKNYYADGLLDKIGEVCERYAVHTWTDLPNNDFFMLDAPSRTVNFIFDDGTKIKLTNNTRTPDAWREVSSAISELIEESETYGIDAAVELSPFGMMMGKTEIIRVQPKSGAAAPAAPASAPTAEVAPDAPAPEKKAKFCPTCGYKAGGNSKFCPECGAIL